MLRFCTVGTTHRSNRNKVVRDTDLNGTLCVLFPSPFFCSLGKNKWQSFFFPLSTDTTLFAVNNYVGTLLNVIMCFCNLRCDMIVSRVIDYSLVDRNCILYNLNMYQKCLPFACNTSPFTYLRVNNKKVDLQHSFVVFLSQ